MVEASRMLIAGMMKDTTFMDGHAECVVSIQYGLSSEPDLHIYLIILSQRILKLIRSPQAGLTAVACQAANVISHGSGLSMLRDAAIGQKLGHICGLTGGHQLIIVHRVDINVQSPMRQQGVIVLQNPGPCDVPCAALKKKLKGILQLDLHAPADHLWRPLHMRACNRTELGTGTLSSSRPNCAVNQMLSGLFAPQPTSVIALLGQHAGFED